MANHGGAGSKFVSVNLNKSYGQSSRHSYGQAAASHARPGSGGGGGMVVLSRSRTAQKPGPKLSVPPPLNLPSLRKEHEKLEFSGPGGGPAGAGGPGGGARPSSSGMGWTKPAAVAVQEKVSGSDSQLVDGVEQNENGNIGNSSYMPPSARPGGVGLPVLGSGKGIVPSVEKVSVLRGEDFPSLRAALPTPSGSVQKQKDNLSQRQKLVVGDESTNDHREGYHSSSLVDMRPQGQSSHQNGNVSVGGQGEGRGLGSSANADKAQKRDEYFPGPLPLVRLTPRSDWADDERDTGHGFSDQGRDIGLIKSENFWHRDFDMPRVSVPPHKPAQINQERWGRADETVKRFSNHVPKVDSHPGDVRSPSRDMREGNLRKTPGLQEVAIDRNGNDARPTSSNKDSTKESKYIPPRLSDNNWDSGVSGSRDSSFLKRDLGHASDGRHQLNTSAESYNTRLAERVPGDHYGTESSNRYRGNNYQNNSKAKISFASGGQMHSNTDPASDYGTDRRVLSKTAKPSVESNFLKDFDSAGFGDRDPFTGGLVGVIKRKKDAIKQADFHDPVRESFEAELERVQKMQELERQRIIEEQEKAMEHARREEEEKLRLIREEEERQRRLEEEAREAAWRAEQERLEAIRLAEEQRIAREEEKKRISMEEERRKQAAKQKLLELEAKIAKRKEEASKGDDSTGTASVDEKIPTALEEKDVPGEADFDNWEDSDRMVEKITTSASYDSSLGRPFDVSSRLYPSREGSHGMPDREKPINSWRRDVFENSSSSYSPLHDQEIGYYSSRRDAYTGGRAVPRKDFYGGAGYMSSRNHFKGGTQNAYTDFSNQREQRMNRPNFFEDTDSYSKSRETDTEFHSNLVDRYGDIGWGYDHSHSGTQFPYPDGDESFSYGRSRYSMRQPRVLPPPLAAPQRTSFRAVIERPVPSNFVDNENQHTHVVRDEPTEQTAYYDSSLHEGLEPSELHLPQSNHSGEDQNLNNDRTPRCDSQSSLSVSSPPNSPPHLSHDELDESVDSHMIAANGEGKTVAVAGNESVLLSKNSGNGVTISASSSISAVEDDDWTENNDELQQQEEYDEDEDGYQEEEEMRERDDNLDLNREFEDLHLEDECNIMDNVVLGFDQGVEVKLPNDDFEGNSRNEEPMIEVSDNLVCITEEKGMADGVLGSQPIVKLELGSSQPSSDGSFSRIQETERVMKDSTISSINVSYASGTPDLASSSSGLYVHSIDMPPTSCRTVMPPVSSSPGQADLPKLQFGLFSGPSLIPSPVPAIQIGSIQMPLHLHPPASYSHAQQSQPPIFQFGQLRYTSPVSHGILSIAPQPMSFLQPNMPGRHESKTNDSPSNQASQETSLQNVGKTNNPTFSLKSEMGFVSATSNLSHGNTSKGLGCGPEREIRGRTVHATNGEGLGVGHVKLKPEVGTQADDRLKHESSCNTTLSTDEKGSESLLRPVQVSTQSDSREKVSGGFKNRGPLLGHKGKRFAYSVRNSSERASFPASEAPLSGSSGSQRRGRRTAQQTEYRIRENFDKQQPGFTPANSFGTDDRSNYNGRAAGVSARSGSKRVGISYKPSKQRVESEDDNSQVADSGRSSLKEIAKDAAMKGQNVSHTGEVILKRSVSGEDVDAPLESGVVHVFKQPGIEAPSDEDDFIEVRSKRQMLNDRREQRKKEIKAQRKPHVSKQDPPSLTPTSSTKTSIQVGEEAPENTFSDVIASEEQGGFLNKEVSRGFTSMMSQPLAPIGTPTMNSVNSGDHTNLKPNTVKSLQTDSVPAVSDGRNNVRQSLMFESTHRITNSDTSSPLSSWSTTGISQQVMAITQTQLEEALKPAQYDANVTSVRGQNSIVGETILPLSSGLAKDKPSVSASPINSLLAGEKIQFGAVTSPTVLPVGSRAVPHEIGAPGSNRSTVPITVNLSATENDSPIYFGKHKQPGSVHLKDCEAEAEAAASAVAAAAISSDEPVGNGLGSVSLSETDINGVATGLASDQQLGSQSMSEESLSVSLPADLSVETPPISLWSSLSSPQSSSSQMLSRFPGGPSSHFPFYEMNPMLGNPMFAFAPHDDSSNAQSQSHKNTDAISGPLGAWQPSHSTVDSFYGPPPTGFPGPYMSPLRGIPGVQGPPHMVVYNHFTPVGQFGQVGLGFMGPTYIPSGPQSDWKHGQASTASDASMTEGDIKTVDTATVQNTPTNIPAPVQHLAPGSPLMPLASPMAMFDVSPYQSAPDLSAQGHWSHVPVSPLHPLPLSWPLQQQAGGLLQPQYGSGRSVNQPLSSHRFSGPHSSTMSENGPVSSVPPDTNVVAQYPGELGLVESGTSTQSSASQGASGSSPADAGESVKLQPGSNRDDKGKNTNVLKSPPSQQKNTPEHLSQSGGHSYQRGGVSQRSTSANEWSRRRTGFHGRNHSYGAEKAYPSKVKQVYVVKQTTNGQKAAS